MNISVSSDEYFFIYILHIICYRFTRLHLLEQHLRLHDNDLDPCFFCPWRGLKSQTSFYEAHLSHHLGIKGPLKCSFCEKRYFQKTPLVLHEETMHERVPDRYQCENCDYKTHSKTLLLRHCAKCEGFE